MAASLIYNIEETVAIILFGIGFTMLLLHRNLIKKIMGMNVMDTAVYLFLASKGYIRGRMVPIVVDGITDASAYINPVPSGLVLTGIVVSVSTTALMLALTIRLYERYHSLDLDEILMHVQREERAVPAEAVQKPARMQWEVTAVFGESGRKPGQVQREERAVPAGVGSKSGQMQVQKEERS